MSPVDSRLVETRRQDLVDALMDYAEAAKEWNAPDDAHTRLTLRGMVEDTIKEVVPE